MHLCCVSGIAVAWRPPLPTQDAAADTCIHLGLHTYTPAHRRALTAAYTHSARLQLLKAVPGGRGASPGHTGALRGLRGLYLASTVYVQLA